MDELPMITLPTSAELTAAACRRLADVRDTYGERVERKPRLSGGEPAFNGTRITVLNIGGMYEHGEPLADIIEDYHPYLAERDVENARMFFRIH